MKKKKIFAMIILAAMLLILCACEKPAGDNDSNVSDDRPIETFDPDMVIEWRDPYVEKSVRAELGLYEYDYEDDSFSGFNNEPITVSDVSSIEELDIWGQDIWNGDYTGVNVVNLYDLKYFANLKKLTIWRSDVRDLSPLYSLTGLCELDFVQGYQDVTQFAGLTQLTGLNFMCFYQDIDLSPIAELTNLESFGVQNAYAEYDQIIDLKPLLGLTKLKNLSISGNFSDLSPLSQLTSLETLWIDSENIVDISPISSLTNLRTLRVMCESTRPVDIKGLQALAELAGLKRLILDYTAITYIPSLKKLTSLEELFLNNTMIDDISPLDGLVSLTHLNISDTLVSDISVLAGLTSLKTLVMCNLSITDLSPLSGLTSLEYLDIRGCDNIKDLTPVKNLPNLRTLDTEWED